MLLDKSQNSFAESFAAFGIGQGFKEFLPAEALHLSQNLLDGAPVGNGCFEPLILFLGQCDTNRLAFDFACPGIASTPGTGSSILHIAFTDPARLGQLRLEAGVFLAAGRRRGGFVSVHE